MKISFTGKYKSINSFVWDDIPNFVVITGPNGTGKSQLLELIYNTIINKAQTTERVGIDGFYLDADEVTYLRGEWQLQNTGSLDLYTIQQNIQSKFNNHRQTQLGNNSEHNVKVNSALKRVLKKTGKHQTNLTIEEFLEYYPDFVIERESELSQKIGEFFYNYRLSEIELQAKYLSPIQIKEELGEKPWVILRDILREAKLQFEINDPSENGFRDKYRLILTSSISKEPIDFNDLSSGEKVLISLVFYLYNSQEKKIFPKLLLLDEPDAHLHPSMSQQFLNVVKNVLVDKFGVRVIMTTHSPSTVILAPYDSIYEMSKQEPRIKKSPSKNHSVSLLTAGLVYVGEGTKYFLVEDNDDVNFYSYIYAQLISDRLIDSNIPLVFIPASTKNNTGGKSVVQDWVQKLENSGLYSIVQGLIDADSGNTVSGGVFKIDRYSIENYLIDPVLVFAVLVDFERTPSIEGLALSVGEEYKLKSLDQILLQRIADYINNQIEPKITTAIFPDFDLSENDRIEVEFTNKIKLSYPKWLLHRRGKSLMSLYTTTFSSNVNFGNLSKAMKKINVFPMDLVNKFNEIKGGI